jgi:hypothetical protein
MPRKFKSFGGVKKLKPLSKGGCHQRQARWTSSGIVIAYQLLYHIFAARQPDDIKISVVPAKVRCHNLRMYQSGVQMS